MTNNISSLTSDRETNEYVEIGDGLVVEIMQVETILSTTAADGMGTKVENNEVVFVIDVTTNLLSF